MANQPKHLGGILENDSADKAAKFIQILDAFNLPIVFLQDVPGFMVGSKVEHAGIIRHGAKFLHVMSAATVPKITVIVRKAYGAGYYVMCGRAYEPDLIVAWPSAEVSVMGAEGMVGIAAKKLFGPEEPPPEVKQQIVADDPEEHRHLQSRGLGPGGRRDRSARHAAGDRLGSRAFAEQTRRTAGSQTWDHPRVKPRDLGLSAASALLTAIAVVTVFAVSDRFGRVSDRSREAASEQLPADGGAPADGAEGSRRPEERRATGQVGEGLVREIADLNRKLYGIEKEKARLEAQLARAERELSKQTEASAVRARHEFDLDEQDWRELAKSGTIKFRRPCLEEKGWKARPDELELLGLGVDDGEVLRAAFRRSYDRIWKTVRPLCAKVIGGVDIVDSLGPDTCIHVVVDASRREDNALADEAIGRLPRHAPASEQFLHRVPRYIRCFSCFGC